MDELCLLGRTRPSGAAAPHAERGPQDNFHPNRGALQKYRERRDVSAASPICGEDSEETEPAEGTAGPLTSGNRSHCGIKANRVDLQGHAVTLTRVTATAMRTPRGMEADGRCVHTPRSTSDRQQVPDSGAQGQTLRLGPRGHQAAPHGPRTSGSRGTAWRVSAGRQDPPSPWLSRQPGWAEPGTLLGTQFLLRMRRREGRVEDGRDQRDTGGGSLRLWE